MHFQRRKLLRNLSVAFGANLLWSRTQLGLASQTALLPKRSPSSEAAVGAVDIAGATETERVAGIGGFFFRAKDPKALGRWYQQHLGISLSPSNEGDPVWEQEAGPTLFTPFPETTKYFGDIQKNWMINFRVRNLDKLLAQLRAAGVEVKMESQSDADVKFARIHDPEGNPIELWQPKPSGVKGF